MSSLAPFLHGGVWYVGIFLLVLTVLVFVHELGHYLIARRNGVRIEVFSIGFGPELFGWFDRAGTRWKFSAIPLGGYVRMFGDSDPSSSMGIARLGEPHLPRGPREVICDGHGHTEVSDRARWASAAPCGRWRRSARPPTSSAITAAVTPRPTIEM